MWERLTLKKAWVRSGLAEVEQERQNGTDGDMGNRSRRARKSLNLSGAAVTFVSKVY